MKWNDEESRKEKKLMQRKKGDKGWDDATWPDEDAEEMFERAGFYLGPI